MEGILRTSSTYLSEVSIPAISTSFAYDYVFTTVPFSAIHHYVLPVTKHLVLSFVQCLHSLVLLLVYVVLIVMKVCILAFPHAMHVMRLVYDFHRTQLTKTDIIIEFTAIFLLLFILLFRERILRLWKSIELYISAKSKAAARAAPHVLFFTTAFIFAIVGKKFILPLTSSYTMPIFTLLLPWLSGMWLERKIRQSTDVERKLLTQMSQQMVLWVVLAIYHAIVTLLSLVPFSQSILRYLPYLKEIVIVIIIWAQISNVFTDIVYTSVISPVMIKLSHYIPTANTVHQHQQRASTIASTLKMMRILTDHQLRIIQAVLQDSLVSILALICVFIPNPFASIGMVVVALLLPAYRTVTANNMIRNHLHPTRNVTESKVSHEFLQQQATQWINYWLCLGFLWLLRIYATTIWPSVMICISLWLQHTYFAGATKAIDTTYSSLCLMAERNKQIQTQRKLQRERQKAEKKELEAALETKADRAPTNTTEKKEDNIESAGVRSLEEEEEVEKTHTSDEGDYVKVKSDDEKEVDQGTFNDHDEEIPKSSTSTISGVKDSPDTTLKRRNRKD